jgi:hypothetical protein
VTPASKNDVGATRGFDNAIIDGILGAWMIRFSIGRSDRARVEAQEAREAFGSFKIPIHEDLKDPAAVERALEEIDRAVEERVARYPENKLVRDMGESIRKKARRALLDRVAGMKDSGA